MMLAKDKYELESRMNNIKQKWIERGYDVCVVRFSENKDKNRWEGLLCLTKPLDR